MDQARQRKPLTFRTEGAGKPDDVTLLPFYRMFGQRYACMGLLFACPMERDAGLTSALPDGVVDSRVD